MVAEAEAQKYVRRIANRFARRNNADAEELFQVGYVGLLKAKGTFDPSRGVPFLSYSQYRIASEIKDHLRSFVRRPHGLGQRIGDKPVEVFSYDESEAEEGSMYARVDDVKAMADKTTPEGLCDVAQAESDLRARVELLPSRLREIIRRIFWEDETLREIGEHMGLSAERIRQLKEKALQQMMSKGKEGIMGKLSQNVIDETARAIQASKTQAEVAAKLGISEQGVYFRIRSNPELERIAIERGIRRPLVKKEHPDGTYHQAPAPKPEPRPHPTPAPEAAPQGETPIPGPHHLDATAIPSFPRVDFGFQGNVTFLGVNYRVNISVGRV